MNFSGILHLAQVQKNPTSAEMELQLLAYEKSEYTWEFIEEKSISLDKIYGLNEGVLVLVILDEHWKILHLIQAKNWVINLIKKYLIEYTITPEFIAREQARVEQWRQELTAKSLDLNRQHLEIEARREELQELEKNLQQEQEKLKFNNN